MQETSYHFRIPDPDYTKFNLDSRATKDTNSYDFLSKIIFNLMHLQFNFVHPEKLEFQKLSNNNNSLEYIFSSEKLHQYSYENINAQDVHHTNKHHIFFSNKISFLYTYSAQFHLESSCFHGRIRNCNPLKV